MQYQQRVFFNGETVTPLLRRFLFRGHSVLCEAWWSIVLLPNSSFSLLLYIFFYFSKRSQSIVNIFQSSSNFVFYFLNKLTLNEENIGVNTDNAIFSWFNVNSFSVGNIKILLHIHIITGHLYSLIKILKFLFN